jgi:hypothetical protein
VPYAQRFVVGLGLLATGVSAASYHFEQNNTIGGCGYGGKHYDVRLGPPCPPGWNKMLIVMLVGLGVALLGATIYAARGTADDDPANVRREPYYIANLRLWPTIAVAFVVAEFIHPDTRQFRPGLEVIFIAVGSVLAVVALGIRTARWWEHLGSDPPPPPIVDQRIRAGRGNMLPAAVALLVMLVGAYAAYMLQRSVGPTAPPL